MKIGIKAVPKEINANLAYRDDLLKAAKRDTGLQAVIRDACREDLLFWANTFLYTFDPRKADRGEYPDMPWLTWDYQDDALLSVQRCLGKRHVGIDKARDMGASIILLASFLHPWQFRRGMSFMLVSRNEALVDCTGNTDTLFWKLMYMLKCQPRWLQPGNGLGWDKMLLTLVNTELDCYINGTANTEDAGRGGRRTAVGWDECAATPMPQGYAMLSAISPVTNCILFNSTYQGACGAFYDQMQRKDIERVEMDWWQNPTHAEGLTWENGKRTSPWYRSQCATIIVPAKIASELDRNPLASASRFFLDSILNQCELDCREPRTVGRFEHLGGRYPEFYADPAGIVQLWLPLVNGKPPIDGSYSVGVDVSMGARATPSVASVTDKLTGEKVCQVATSLLGPTEFAELVVALCTWFNEAYLIWEMNGPGIPFGQKVVDLGYRNIYDLGDEAITGQATRTRVPGFHTSPSSKDTLLTLFQRAMSDGSYIQRSKPALDECRQYQVGMDNHAFNPKASKAAVHDPGDAGQNHGDLVIADALSVRGLRELMLPKPGEVQRVPMYSLMWRMNEHKRLAQAKAYW